jgi:hypothetical protein
MLYYNTWQAYKPIVFTLFVSTFTCSRARHQLLPESTRDAGIAEQVTEPLVPPPLSP